MFTFNSRNNFITGTINGESFGVNFTPELFSKMQDLETQYESATTPAEVSAIVELFKLLTTENPSDNRQSEIHPDIYVSNEGKYYLKVGDKISSVAMPENLTWRFLNSKDKGIDVTPLIKFWINTLRNHKLRVICKTDDQRTAFVQRLFNYVDTDFVNVTWMNQLINDKGYTEDVARELATVKEVKITKEGLLATFKVSHEITKRYRLNDKGEKEAFDAYEAKVIGVDEITGMLIYDDKPSFNNDSRVFAPSVMGDSGDDFFCGDVKGHIIRVGKVHRLESWDQINTNDSQSCVKGLHVGGLTYIRGYQNQGTETHNILVNPMHVGAVTDDGSGALRVMQYFVLDAFSGTNGSIYHSSTYAAMTDSQWATEKAEILKEFGELKAKQAEKIDKAVESLV